MNAYFVSWASSSGVGTISNVCLCGSGL